MAEVHFSSELQAFTGESNAQIDASDYRVLIDALCDRYPKLNRSSLMEMAVAIDGVIIVDPLLEPLHETSEVHFLHFVAGG